MKFYDKSEKRKEFISVVMPVYNEKSLMDGAVKKTLTALERDFERYEFVIVDDGSSDGTCDIVSSYSSKNPHMKVIRHEKNENLGRALKTGFFNSMGEYVFFNSADLPFDPSDLKLLFERCGSFDLVNVERKKYAGASAWRKTVSSCNKILLHALFPYASKDFRDMNFTALIKRECLKNILPQSVSPGFFMPEMILRARYKNLNVKRIQMKYLPRFKGRAHFGKIKDITWSVCDMFRFRFKKLNFEEK